MAQLFARSYGIRSHNTTITEIDHGPDGYSGGTAATTTETSAAYAFGDDPTNAVALACPGTSTATSWRGHPFTAPAAGVSLFPGVWIYVTALPTAAKTIYDFNGNLKAKLDHNGKFSLWNGATQLGSDSILTAEAGKFYHIQPKQTIAAGAADVAELRLTALADPGHIESIGASTGLTITDTQPTLVRVGWIEAPGVTSTMLIKHHILNDSTGTVENSWVGPVKRVAFLPVGGFFSSTSSWVSCTGSTSRAVQVLPLRNTPPQGQADSTSHSTSESPLHQIRSTTTTAIKPLSVSPIGVGIPGHLMNYSGTTASSSVDLGDRSATFKVCYGFRMLGQILRVSLLLGKTGSPTDNLIVRLYPDDATATEPGTRPNLAAPIQTLVDIAGTDASLPTTGFSEFIYNFTTPLNVSNADVIWVVYERSGAISASNYYRAATHGTRSSGDTPGNLYSDLGVWFAGSPSYGTAAGVGVFNAYGASRAIALQSFLLHAEGIATGTKAGQFSATNPTIANVTFNFGDDIGAGGTYASTGAAAGNWKWVKSGIVHNPDMNMGMGPNYSVNKTTSDTRVVMVAHVGAYFTYEPPPTDWRRYQKTADSTYHWVQQNPTDTEWQISDTELVTCEAGSYWIIADSAMNDDGIYTSAQVGTIEEPTLFADYTSAP